MNKLATLRMRDLSRRSGFAPSAVRFYLQQGLLPEPERPTPNSALYDERHIAALDVLRTLKAAAPDLPIEQIRRVMELVNSGVEPDVALALHRSVAGSATRPGHAASRMSLEEAAAAAGVTPGFVEDLVNRQIVAPVPGSDLFDAADLETLGAMALLEGMVPGSIGEVEEIASLIRRASALEMALRNRTSKGQDTQAAAEISRQMQDWANFWHAYLFSRFRLADIAEHGLGETSKSPSRAGDDR